ncbi:hypothetical protein FE374_09340 [Georgenia yuyongxinii]|uniref:Uncharacterized protein n=1 Tax=Georgenia yuyongxinii TaxID=2589797 RepID=A0A5B8C3E9_9MICO|nr:hypothetical protein [Georgenia yuyongxinii]QDC24788.1 hypothetical protein FE374_09340 [Georgenia yuyongxinii]
MAARTFVSSLRSFQKASPWLGPEHDPALVMLEAMAKELDGGELTPALLSQFGLAYRSLQKLAPRSDRGEVDPLDEVLAERGR